MDSDRIEGKGKELKGRVEEAAGALTNDHQIRQQGRKHQSTGEVQEKWGEVKDKVRDVADDVRR